MVEIRATNNVIDSSTGNVVDKSQGLSSILGEKIIDAITSLKGIIAFTLITLVVIIKKLNKATCVIHPLILAQSKRCGIQLLPMVIFLSIAIGFVVVGQTIAVLSSYGLREMAGVLMVAVIVREIGPLATALLIIGRVGTATVIELGTSRALGEVETLETLGIDPVHFFVMPRVIGIIAGTISCSVYLIIGSLFSGYLFAFVQDVPITPDEYLKQIAYALDWSDFILLLFKACGFGICISMICCYHGLARPINLSDVSVLATKAVMQCVIACLTLDAILIAVYMVALA